MMKKYGKIQEKPNMKFRSYQVGNRYHEFRNMNGSRIYEAERHLYLVISYDNLLKEEIEAFCRAPFEVTFKSKGMASLFLFQFAGSYIVDAPFYLFGAVRKPQMGPHGWGLKDPLTILIFESSDGMLVAKRECRLPESFWIQLDEWAETHYITHAGPDAIARFQQEIKEIYDNHVIEALYELDWEHEITCSVDSGVLVSF